MSQQNTSLSGVIPSLGEIRILELTLVGVYSFGHTVIPEEFWNSEGLTMVNGYDFNTKSNNQTGKSKICSALYLAITGEDVYKDVGVNDVVNYNMDCGMYIGLRYIDRHGKTCLLQRYRNYKPFPGSPEIYTAEGVVTGAKSTGVTLRVDSEFLHKEAIGESGVEDRIKRSFGYSKTLLKLAMVTPQKENPASILLKNSRGDADKKALLDELTGAKFVVPAYKAVNQDLLNAQKAVEVIQTQVEVAYGTINDTKSDLEKLRSESLEFTAKLDREAEQLISEKTLVSEEIEKLKVKVVDESEMAAVKKDIDTTKDDINTIKSESSQNVADSRFEIEHGSATKDLQNASRDLKAAKAQTLSTITKSNGEIPSEFASLSAKVDLGTGIEEAILAIEKESLELSLKNQKDLEVAKESQVAAEAVVAKLSSEDLTLRDESPFKANLNEVQEKIINVKTQISTVKNLDQNLVAKHASAQNDLANALSQAKATEENITTLSAHLGDSESEARELAAFKAAVSGLTKPPQTKEELETIKEKYEAAVSQIKTGISVLEGKLESEKEKLKAFENGSNCPTCHQPVTADHAEHTKKAKLTVEANVAAISAELEKQKGRIPNGEKLIVEAKSQIHSLSIFSKIEVLEKDIANKANIVTAVEVKKAELNLLKAKLSSLEAAVETAKSSLDASKADAESRAQELSAELTKLEEMKAALSADLEEVTKENRNKSLKIKELNDNSLLSSKMQGEVLKLSSIKTPFEVLQASGFIQKSAEIKVKASEFMLAFINEEKAKAAFDQEKARVQTKRDELNALLASKNEKLGALFTKQAEIEELLKAMAETASLIAEKTSVLAGIATKLEMLSKRANPFTELIEGKYAKLQEQESTVAQYQTKVEKLKSDIRELEEIKWLFSPEGLRSYLADPVIEKLNRYVNEYLNETFFGEVKVNWTPEKSGKSGTTNEITVEIIANGGVSKLGLASGAEEDYPSVATNLAVGRIAEENMGIRAPFRSFDEPLKFIDSEGQARVMALLNRVAREGKQKVFLISHDQNLKMFAQNTAWVIKKDHISRFSTHPEGLEGELRDHESGSVDPHDVPTKQAVKNLIAGGEKKKRAKKVKTEEAS